jgi:hypothetical protein
MPGSHVLLSRFVRQVGNRQSSPGAACANNCVHAVAVFDEHKATHWLSTPLPLIDNRTPSDLMETDEGLERVEQILTRIEHNVPSDRSLKTYCGALSDLGPAPSADDIAEVRRDMFERPAEA